MIFYTERIVFRSFTSTKYLFLYTGLFLPRDIFPHLHFQTVSPYNVKQSNFPSLKFANDNEGKTGENKTRAKISL